jgi:hypothetical protein
MSKIYLLKLKKIYDRIFIDQHELKFIQSVKNFNLKNISTKNTVVVNLQKNFFTLLHLYFLLSDEKFKGSKIVGIWSDLDDINLVQCKPFYFVRQLIIYLEKKKWLKLYKSFGVHNVISIYDENNYFKLKKNINVKKLEDVKKMLKPLNFHLYNAFKETYIRMFCTPKFNKNDLKKINYLINKVFVGMQNLNFLYKKYKPNYYLFHQNAYIQLALPLIFFIKKNLTCYGGVPGMRYYIKKYSLNNPDELQDWKKFKKLFLKEKNKSKKILTAKKVLKDKFRGKKINIEFFLKKQVYNMNQDIKLEKFKCIIFFPDFYDSKRNLQFLFDDYYSWAIETLDYVKKYNKQVAIKTHPNSISESKVIENEIKLKYPNFYWLPNNISNHIIFKSKINIGISPQGTVLYEMSYHNIPSVSAGSHASQAYDFVFTPETKKKYFEIIYKLMNNKLNYKKNVKDLYKFFYMYALKDNNNFPTISQKINLLHYDTEKSEVLSKVINSYNNYFRNIS